jgi:hypothetical protein
MANELMSRRPYVDAYSAIQEGRARTMAERQAEEALRFNQARQMAAANSLRAGRVDPVAYSNELARMGFAHMVPGEQKPLYELEEQVGKSQEALGKGAQAQAKVLSDRFQYFRDLAPANPSLAPGWVNAVYTDPIVGPELAKFGTPEEVIAAIPSDATEYNKWLEGVSMVAGDYAKRRVPTAEAMLPYTQPKSPEVFAQDVAQASAGASKISIAPAAKKFGETFGERAAQQFDNLYTQAQGAEQSINLSRRLKPLLQNPDFISGTLGNVRLELAKALDLPGAEKTQSYFAGIGGQVAQIIKNFGAGTGLSNKDLEFAEKMAGGNINLTTDAIKRIVRLNDEASKYVLKKYNTRRSELSRKNAEIADYYPEVRVAVREGTITSGPDKGRRVVEYSDGTSEYAD